MFVNKIKQNLYSNDQFILLLGVIGFLIHFFVFYPGLMSPDSNTIYQSAINHSYSDHHPPMLGLLWHYLNFIIKGPHLLYLFNITMLWLGIYVLVFKVFLDKKWKFLCLCIPFFPQMLVYSGWIWKDIIFTYSYGLLSCFLAHKYVNQKRISNIETLLFSILLIYSTSVKFQAQYIMPILIFWFCNVKFRYSFKLNVIATILISILSIQLISNINSTIVNTKGTGSSYSWQYVKIFDLAGMSLHSNEILVPKELWKRKDITVNDIRKAYELAWEPLIVYADSPLNATKNKYERGLLLNKWRTSVLKYPIAYLKHRAYIWCRGLLLSAPSKSAVVEYIKPNGIFKNTLFFLATFSAFIFLLPFFMCFLYIGFKYRTHDTLKLHAHCILYTLSMAGLLLMILFFFSLAAVPRYIYFSNYMLFISAPFAWYCHQENKQKVKVIK